MVWLFLFNFLEGFSVNGLTPAALPAIERQFQLTSTKSSIIPASHDIGALALILFISFISGRTNKITWIASGSLMLALGYLLFIVPHIATEYQYQGKGIYYFTCYYYDVNLYSAVSKMTIRRKFRPTCFKRSNLIWPRGYSTFFMLNSAER